uniref:Coiled-coil and C2 domain-containing protein 1B n=1 Tax=Oryzias latipes TaxID=8090 RepID=A0A3P9K6T5_ORYLA
MSRSRNPPPRGQGAARAKQMGLLLDLNPDGGMDDVGNDEDLEAELLNLVGGGGRAQGKKEQGRPVPMAEIERMAALCMKDLDDEEMEDEDLDDDDLLAELNEVLEDDEEPAPAAPKAMPSSQPAPSASPLGAASLESRLLERIEMYQTAIANAKAAGETSKARRYDRGLKTLQSMLTSVKKGKAVNEEDMPPPVAIGGKSNIKAESEPEKELPEPAVLPASPSKPRNEPAAPVPNTKPVCLTPLPKLAAPITPDSPAISPLTPSQPSGPHSLKQAVLSRQREYKVAALQAKQSNDVERAKHHYLTAKKLDSLLEALDRGEAVQLSSLPPPPLPAPSSLGEALQQRMDIYKQAAESAKSKGDDRKSRMHQRIQQYQEAIRAHKAGKPVSLSDLPVPPCPALQGSEGSQQNFLNVLETAMKIANQDGDAENMVGAAQHLRHAKGLDPMITATKSGLPVEITKKCLDLCQQFTQTGNIGECDKLAAESMKSIEILKKAHAAGQPVPKCRSEERTLNSLRNSNLTASDMVLYIVRGTSLPAPPGVSPSDLDASVKFEFPFPSSEEAQRDKTGTVKNTNNPFKENFKLHINRGHRAFKRAVQSKGIKFEVIHKGLFKTDRVVGTAHLKLEALETHCDIREIIDVFDGRKATGGKLEVRVKIREPLSGAELQPVTEKWLVVEPGSSLSPPERGKERAPSPRSKPNTSPPQYKLHSFSLLNYDKERLERKILEYQRSRRDPPPDLSCQLKEVVHRLQWQKAQLERASPALLKYEVVLQRFVQGLSESVKKYSSQGNRQEAAKDALGRLKMVENE